MKIFHLFPIFSDTSAFCSSLWEITGRLPLRCRCSQFTTLMYSCLPDHSKNELYINQRFPNRIASLGGKDRRWQCPCSQGHPLTRRGGSSTKLGHIESRNHRKRQAVNRRLPVVTDPRRNRRAGKRGLGRTPDICCGSTNRGPAKSRSVENDRPCLIQTNAEGVS